MTGAGSRGRRIARGAALGLAAILSASPVSTPAALRSSTPEGRGTAVDAAGGAGAGSVFRAGRERLKKKHRRITAPARFQAVAYPEVLAPGGRVLVTVRLVGAGDGAARHAAFYLGADPALLRYVGFRPTGRGALAVEPSSHPGEIVAYRSSGPGGFAQVEDLAVLEFESVGAGNLSIVVYDTRLFDRKAHELACTHGTADIVIE